MNRKKILHLISGLEIGGTETQLLRILPELQKYHENRVCCVRGHGPIGLELEKNGVKVYYLNLKNIFDILVIKRFHKIVREFNPNILVTYLIHADIYGRILGKTFGIEKIISSKRGSLLQWEWLSFFDRATKWMVNHYLIQTETAKKEWMKKLKLSEKFFSVIPNGIEIEKFRIQIDKDKKCKELNVKNGSFIITCVSRLRRGKGHAILLAAFEKIFSNNPNAILLLAGDGEKEIELKEQIKNYVSKKSVIFLGNRNDIPEILAVSDLFILPTEGEGMSNAIIEAMSTGIAIITTDIDTNKDLVRDGETGILFPTNNIDSLSNKIGLLINNHNLRKTLGYNAQKKAASCFDYKEIALRLAEFYNKQ